MANKSNIIKLKKRKTINLGVIIFIFIFVYLAIYLIFYFSKEHLSIYEVSLESLALESVAKGVIIREETVYYTNKAGRINFYLQDGARVKKNAMVYSIDDNNLVYNMQIDDKANFTFDENDVSQIKRMITSFNKKFSEDEFSTVYAFKENITGTVLELIDLSLMDNLINIMAETGLSGALDTVRSDQSGVISYHVDSYDGLLESEVNQVTFLSDDFSEKTTKTTDLNEIGAKVYKLVTSENWEIIVPIEKMLFELLSEKTNVSIVILNDGFETNVPVSVYTMGIEYYAKLSFDKYMIRYKNERFLDIEFLVQNGSGLKIPISAIVKKEFFLVPLNYFTYGGNNNELGVVKKSFDSETGKETFTYTATEIYYQDEEYAYVSTDLFDFNTYLYSEELGETYRIASIDELEGVYNVNKGYAIFRRIERITSNNEYCIVRENTSNGLSLYDHIALDASTAEDSKIIY